MFSHIKTSRCLRPICFNFTSSAITTSPSLVYRKNLSSLASSSNTPSTTADFDSSSAMFQLAPNSRNQQQRNGVHSSSPAHGNPKYVPYISIYLSILLPLRYYLLIHSLALIVTESMTPQTPVTFANTFEPMA